MANKYEHLVFDDYFEYQGNNFKVIKTIKGGSCGCTPLYNAQSIDDPEIYTFFANGHKVNKIFRFRTHPDNIDYVYGRECHKKRIVEIGDNMPKTSDTIYVKPLVVDSLVEYEETDIWLIHFGLGTPVRIPYYEKFEDSTWVGKA